MAFMAQRIEVPELPDDAYDVLLARAQAYGLSVERYVRALLIDEAARPTAAEVFERAAAEPSSGVSAQEIVDLIRADRESR